MLSCFTDEAGAQDMAAGYYLAALVFHDQAKGLGRLEARLRKDIIDFVFDRLDDFQLYDQVAIYYDGGQEAVTASLHGAFDYALARNVAIYKPLSHQEKRLAQAADYLCTIGLAERRYERGDVSASYRRFFGTRRNFRQNYLKQVRRKLA